LTPDHLAEAEAEIARRRRALLAERSRAAVARSVDETRAFYREHPELLPLLESYLDRFEMLRLTERVAFGWRSVNPSVLLALVRLAALKLAELMAEEGEGVDRG
jgi:hypothetical protein